MPPPPDETTHGALDQPHDSPVTVWLRQLEVGDSQAAQPLYQHFCSRLHELARQRIPTNVRSAYDQDDVVVSAFHSLFLGVRERRYRFDDRADFWRLLITIAERKITKRVRYETRDKRDVRRVLQDSVFLPSPREGAEHVPNGVASLAGAEPTAEFAVEVAETCEALLASLPDDTSRKIAMLKLDNHTADEIAAHLNCTRRTVQRKLLVIRRTWQHVEGVEFEGVEFEGVELEGDDLSQSGDKRALD